VRSARGNLASTSGAILKAPPIKKKTLAERIMAGAEVLRMLALEPNARKPSHSHHSC
jgi:hypothetical protein